MLEDTTMQTILLVDEGEWILLILMNKHVLPSPSHNKFMFCRTISKHITTVDYFKRKTRKHIHCHSLKFNFFCQMAMGSCTISRSSVWERFLREQSTCFEPLIFVCVIYQLSWSCAKTCIRAQWLTSSFSFSRWCTNWTISDQNSLFSTWTTFFLLLAGAKSFIHYWQQPRDFLEQTAAWIQVHILLMLKNEVSWLVNSCVVQEAQTVNISNSFSKVQILYIFVLFYCWDSPVHCLWPLTAFVHNDCAKHHVMRAKDAMEIQCIDLCIWQSSVFSVQCALLPSRGVNHVLLLECWIN